MHGIGSNPSGEAEKDRQAIGMALWKRGKPQPPGSEEDEEEEEDDEKYLMGTLKTFQF